MSVPLQVYITQGNTQDLKLIGLQDIDTLVFWNAATASASLYDRWGNPTVLTGIMLTYIPGSLGQYVGTFTVGYDLPVGSGYTLKLDAAEGGAAFHLELFAEVIVRSS